MSKNSFDEIKQAEQQAEEIVAKARQDVENSVLQAKENGEKSLNSTITKDPFSDSWFFKALK